jgi:hypothetical protein
MVAAHVGGHGKGFPALSYPELLRVTGPLLSLVLRIEDAWQRYNQDTEAVRGSQSGFPLLTPTMQAGQDSMGGWEAQRKCVRCMQGVCGGFCGWQGLANRSMRIQDLYVGPFPIPRFNKE